MNDGSEARLPEPDPLDAKYGLGWFISSRHSLPSVGHTGVYLGYRTYYAHFLDGDLTVIVLMARNYPYSLFLDHIVLPIVDVYLPAAGLPEQVP